MIGVAQEYGSGRVAKWFSEASVADINELWHRFWSKVSRDPNGCWLWIAGCDADGYGRIGISKKIAKAPVVAWWLLAGFLADGLEVCHACDNPPCVRPDHLFAGTHTDNMRDARNKGRLVLPVFTDGLPGERNGRAILTETEVCTIRADYAAGGISQGVLASRYGLTPGAIGRIVRGSGWAQTGGERSVNNYGRTAKHIEHGGIVGTVRDWAQRLGIKPATLKARLGRGVPIERALVGADLRGRA